MRIGLHDSDKNGFPNFALMKISAYHKASGDEVEWWNPMERFDKVYSSKVFTFTPEELMLPEDAIKGGTGYGIYTDLPDAVDNMFPDYSLYPKVNHAIGFLTRGCIRNCPWCVVPRKEGKIRQYKAWNEVKRLDSRDIVFMDNNVLASEWGIEQIEEMIGEDVRVDFNQGLDARLITPEVAEMLGRLRWIRFLRMSCDTDSMLDTVIEKVALLGKHGIKPWRIFVYLLVQDVKSAEFRAVRLRDAGVGVFAQPYRDFENKIEPTQEMKYFANWVNQKQIFNSTRCFQEFKKNRRR